MIKNLNRDVIDLQISVLDGLSFFFEDRDVWRETYSQKFIWIRETISQNLYG
jgi:hypothetical protein